MTIGSFTIIKNEAAFIRAHLESWLPHIDRMCFFDGNSTDGTLEILREYSKKSDKIILEENQDPQDLRDDYVKTFNNCMRRLDTDLCMFIHPDMFLSKPEGIKNIPKDTISATFKVKSFAGEVYGDIFEILGRGERWKNIYRLNNPDLGAHYFGYYGSQNEDIYFSEITGSEHNHYGQDFERYSYPIFHSDIEVKHYSDVRTYSRRLDRMIKCLINQGYSEEIARKLAPNHPRVSLKSDNMLQFVKTEQPSWRKINAN